MDTFKVSKITGAGKVCGMLWSQAMVNRKQYHYTMIYLESFFTVARFSRKDKRGKSILTLKRLTFICYLNEPQI